MKHDVIEKLRLFLNDCPIKSSAKGLRDKPQNDLPLYVSLGRYTFTILVNRLPGEYIMG